MNEPDGLARSTGESAKSESDALTALRRGDSPAFQLLIEELHSSMIRIAASILHDDGAAEDVVQDTWLAVVRGLHRFENRSALRTWILAILVRRARTAASRSSYVTALHQRALSARAFQEHLADVCSPEAICLERESAECVEEALGTLSPRQRQVLVLRLVDGRSPAEVNELLGINPVHQRVLLHRARQRLRVLLGHREASRV